KREERHEPAERNERDHDARPAAASDEPRTPEAHTPSPATGNDGQQDGAGSAGPAPAHQNQGGPAHGGGGHGGDWQDRGGDRGGRDFWKRNKRKRGRHGGGGGGHWQPGGGGQQREQHPPQPAPPSNAPVFGELPNPSRFEDLKALDTLANEISAGGGEPIYLNEVYAKTLADLTTFAREVGAAFEGAPNKKQLLTAILSTAAERKRPLKDRGYIDVTDRGAFIVHEHVNYRLYPEDPYLPESLVKLYGLKRGHRVEVLVQAPQPGERCPSVVRVESVMGMAPAEIAKITPFEELIPYYPLQRILLESEETQKDVSMRALDILTPIGFGQRALIVAPPRTGKTVLLQNIANSITANSPHAKLILLLIDERPEEVTDFRRHTKGEVVSSTFDETPESHVHCAEMVIENARRRVELGEHVVILLDSITRLARAYNALAGNQGKTMSGGLESNALQKPKRFFGSARNIEGGGSLTIIASALIDTGSRMDEIIFEEFKGTGNCELHLDRGLVERRIFPAINIDRSGTRKEELIYHPEELQRIYGLRRAMQGLGPIESMEMLITRLKKTKSNAEFLL
ncbi:MAG TPA: transcription termination factor Rho, partial [Opitutus sp.]|nr:transcription termination factor Rho [Opitutus sp.]